MKQLDNDTAIEGLDASVMYYEQDQTEFEYKFIEFLFFKFYQTNVTLEGYK